MVRVPVEIPKKSGDVTLTCAHDRVLMIKKVSTGNYYLRVEGTQRVRWASFAYAAVRGRGEVTSRNGCRAFVGPVSGGGGWRWEVAPVGYEVLDPGRTLGVGTARSKAEAKRAASRELDKVVLCDKCDKPNDRADEGNYCSVCAGAYKARIRQDPETRPVGSCPSSGKTVRATGDYVRCAWCGETFKTEAAEVQRGLATLPPHKKGA